MCIIAVQLSSKEGGGRVGGVANTFHNEQIIMDLHMPLTRQNSISIKSIENWIDRFLKESLKPNKLHFQNIEYKQKHHINKLYAISNFYEQSMHRTVNSYKLHAAVVLISNIRWRPFVPIFNRTKLIPLCHLKIHVSLSSSLSWIKIMKNVACCISK